MTHVPYDVAVKLKEKGLKRELDPAGNLIGYNLSWKDKSNVSYYHVHTQFPSDKEFLFSPSYQDVVDWLRVNHKIIIFVLDVINKPGYYWYGVSKENDENGTWVDSSENPSEDYYYEFNQAIESALTLIYERIN